MNTIIVFTLEDYKIEPLFIGYFISKNIGEIERLKKKLAFEFEIKDLGDA